MTQSVGDLAELAEFLLARLAEDKAVALAASPPGWISYSDGTILAGLNEHGFVLDVADAKDTDRHHNQSGERISKADATHIARWEPGRVLVDCEAKREIVTHCLASAKEAVEHNIPWQATDARHTLELLALPYADRDDLAEKWKL